MKLLIVDDEKLTRDGLAFSIDWQRVGITDVAVADDGINGLEVAGNFEPDIVLSDVRMPRMTGIDMCEALQKNNPDLRIVFMSGYSDKEYLKAAIKLKAVSYVEKPIDEDEITEAVGEAVKLALEGKNDRASKKKSKEMEIEELAGKLCHPKPISTDDIDKLQLIANGKQGAFSILVRVYHFVPAGRAMLDNISGIVRNIISEHYLECIGCQRQGGVFVFHVFGFTSYRDSQKNILGEELVKAISDLDIHFHVVFGKNVDQLIDIYNSYNSSVIELQNCFFIRDRQYRIYRHIDDYKSFPALYGNEATKVFRQGLINGNIDEIYEIMDKSLRGILSYESVLPNQVKDLYYRYFNVVNEVEILHGMKSGSENGSSSVWGMISGCESIFELDEKLRERVDAYLTAIKQRTDTGSTVAMIKEYIESNFSNDMLSIKDISEHVFLSTSYVCTLFKNETGRTLNQYITDFRIEKAKELLLDPRNRIGDISKDVGYSDGNYFGKTFKKQVGMTPSEYRESNVK